MPELSKIDLNADIGEGMPYDKELTAYISSCNIACGGHIGDNQSISETIELAKQNNVKIGAHPSYPDRINFGRKSIDISIEDLISSIDSQLKPFIALCKKANTECHHIKFHGALYNDLKEDKKKSKALVSLLDEKYNGIILYVPPKSVLKSLAEGIIPLHVEGFADRAYNDDLSLVSRQFPGAILESTVKVIQQIHNMVIDRKVQTISGEFQPIKIQTLCIHGDTPSALELAKAINQYFQNHNISIQ